MFMSSGTGAETEVKTPAMVAMAIELGSTGSRLRVHSAVRVQTGFYNYFHTPNLHTVLNLLYI